MNDLSLIIDLLRRGFQLYARDGELHFRANKGELMSSERDRLVQSKQGIIDFLGENRKHVRASFAQQRIWFSNQLDPASPTYNGSASQFHINGELNVDAFERALNIVAERHEILRTHFSSIIGQIVQIVEPHERIALEQFDLREFDDTARAERLEQISADFATRAFDLEKGPLWRPVLVRLSRTEHFFILSMHHVVSDGWSISVFMKELGRVYNAECAGQPHNLHGLPVQYGDYARWQAQWEGAEAWEESLQFWRHHLGEDPPVLELPGDRPRPVESNYEGAAYNFEIPETIVTQARGLAREERVTFFMLMMAAFQTVLHRYSGQNAFQIGTPTTGRTPETENLIGAFINMMAIHADFSNDPSFRDVLRRVQQDLIAASEHQDTPFEEIVRELKPGRGSGVSPIFQSMLVFRQEVQDDEFEFTGLRLSKPIEVSTGTSKYDLTLSAVLDGDKLSAMIEYKTEMFDESTIARFANYFTNLLEHAVNHPETRASQLRLMNETEHESVLSDWQGASVPYAAGLTLDGLLTAQASRTPERVALAYDGEALTYAQLDRRANALAHELSTLGVGPETLVGVYMDRSLELVVALFAILKAGGAYVPLDPGYPNARLAYMLEDAAAPVVLTQSHLQESLPAGYTGRVECVDGWTRETAAPPSINAGDTRLAYVIYTSGSTGQPKGVMNEHRGVVNRILWMQDAFQIGESDAVLQKTPFSFDVSVWEFFWPLAVGAKLVMAKPEGHKDPAYLAETIVAENITTIHFVPSMLQAFLDAADTSQCTSLRRVICSGEALGVPLHDQFFTQMSCELHNLYGPTEAAVDVTHWACAPTEGLTNVPIGYPIANTQTYVLDEHLSPVPIGVPGELYLGGVQVARGYWGQTALTAERFIDNPFGDGRLYKTGDRCRWRADGAIEFLGRLDAQVKVRGFRIEPGEIEAALRTHAGVHHAVVDTKLLGGEPQLVAYLVADTEIPAPDLRAHVCETLPDYMAPQAYVYLDELPLTPSGKLDRNALPEPQAPESTEHYIAPRNDTEHTLAMLWQDLLQTNPIGINDNFFELGGHSLKAVQLANRISAQWNAELPVRAIFESPTIAALAERLEQTATPAPAIQRVNRDEEPQLSFAQQRLWFLDQLDTQRAAYNIPIAVDIEGDLNVDAMRRAITSMVQRHEPLRTTIIERNGRPAAQVAACPEVPFDSIALHNLDEDERRGRIAALTAQETRDPFDLSAGPLVRAKIIQAAGNHYRLLLTLHHIAADGWSIGVILNDLRTFYAAEIGANGGAPAPLQVEYRDYAAWQNNRLHSGALDAQIDYWKSALEEVPVLALPTDRPRPRITTHPGATHAFQIPSATVAAIRSLGQSLNATPFMTMLAAFNAVLSRISGQTDIAIGSPIAGRNDASLENLIGLFVNTLVMRTDCAANPTFRELIGRVRAKTLEAYDNQDVPFERLVEILQPERHLDHTPLFQVMFVLQNAPVPALELPGLTMTPVYSEGDTAKFDLTLVLRESEDGFEARIEYNTDLFDATTIAAFAERYRRVLHAAAEQPETRLSDLPILSQREHEQVINEWNATDTPFPDATTIHQLIQEQARAHPGHEAVRMGNQSLTYAELDARSSLVAQHLIEAGIGHEELVGIFIERGIETVVIALAVWKAGAAFIPLDPEYPAERIAFMIHDAEMRSVIAADANDARLLQSGARVLSLEELTKPTGTGDVQPTAGPRSLAYAIYTSGSTGNPKAALIEHRGVCNLARALSSYFGIQSSYRCLQFAAFSFDAWIAEIVSVLSTGATLCIAQAGERVGEPLAQLLEQQRINLTILPPSALNVLPKRRYPDLHVLITAGEACSESLVKIWAPGRRFINAYGPTETTVCATIHTCDSDASGDPPIGHPIDNFTAYVLDPNGGPVPPGTSGELYVGGVGVARGYLNRAALTRERFLPDPFSDSPDATMYRTGDIVRRRSNGEIEYIGRSDHQIKLRGFRIELGEIESVLRSHSQVGEAVCTVQQPAAQLIAYAQTGGASISPEDLRAYAASRLPAHMVPHFIETLEAFPLTPNGKIDRNALPNVGASRTSALPTTVREQAIAAVWESLLETEGIGVHDNFFDRGGHSLLAVNLVSRLRDAGVHLTLQQVFENPTIAEMAAACEDKPGAEHVDRDSIAIPMQPSGAEPPLFAFPPAGGTVFPYYHLAHLLGTDRPFLALQDPSMQFGLEPFPSIETYAEYFVQHIRSLQPTGPYHFVGWSLGGSVAYEVARQLTAQGETVAFVGMIDSRIHHLHRPKGIRAWFAAWWERALTAINTAASTPAHILNGLYVLTSRTINRIGSGTPTRLRRVQRRLAVTTLRVMLRNAEIANELPEDYEDIEALMPRIAIVPKLLRAHANIDYAYRPLPYAGPITLFRAQELIRGEREPQSEAFGWDEVADRVDIVLVSGNHANMMSEPHIRDLVEKMKRALERCGGAGRPNDSRSPGDVRSTATTR